MSWFTKDVNSEVVEFSPAGAAALREMGGKLYAIIGATHPEGRSDFRGGREQSMNEVAQWIKESLLRLDQDTEASMAEAKYAIAVAKHARAVAAHNKAQAPLLAQRIPLVLSGGDVREIDARLEAFGAAPPPPPPVETNRIPDTEYVFLKADLLAMDLRIRGYPRHGSPYWRRWEVALEEYAISLNLSTGNNSNAEGRFQERRADKNRDTILDTAVLRSLDRGLSLREGINSVASDLHAFTSNTYMQWLDSVRGMIDERDALLKEYGRPDRNPFGVTIPKEKAYEVLAPRLSTQKYNAPKGPGWEMQTAGLRKQYGDRKPPDAAVDARVPMHGREVSVESVLETAGRYVKGLLKPPEDNGPGRGRG